jgi:polar amino acid transport system ATP-binding protein
MKLKVTGLTKTFGNHPVLNGIDLDFDGFHSLVLIGPSGGGKTTLLRILAGLEYPTAGSVELNEKPVLFDEPSLLAHRRGIGTVFQAFNLFPHLTALENVVLPLEKVHGFGREQASDEAMAALRRFQLEKHAGKKPAELSGGQRQRVAIARAVAIKPAVLLFDEPTSALDPEMTAEVLDVIRELRVEGRDLVLVTHQMGFARTVADRAVFLAEGKVQEQGLAQELFDAPKSEACRRFLNTVLKY